MPSKNLFYLVLGAALALCGWWAVAVGEMTVFRSGAPIRSAEVNANFATLKEALEAPVGTERVADGAITVPKLSVGGNQADGKVLKLQNGSLAWANDLLGGGGVAYSAGSGLSLNESTFSLADGGVSRSKLAASGGSDGQVLKLQGGNLIWANDSTGGGGGSSYTADGTSLQLSGATFSVKDGGIGGAKLASGAVNNAKLADGSITANKLSLPLAMTATEKDYIFTIRNLGSGLAVESQAANALVASSPANTAVVGQTSSGMGVMGLSNSKYGVYGRSDSGYGTSGISNSSYGVYGQSEGAEAIYGKSARSMGVVGESSSGTGVMGVGNGGVGVYGRSPNNHGVQGDSNSADGVRGKSANGAGVFGESRNGSAVVGVGEKGYAAEFSGGRFGNGICYFAGGSGWSCTSDRNAKENFRPVDPQQVLDAVGKLPITQWNMKGDALKTPHIGPVAQDFYAAFRVGNDDKTISTSDAQGVALAAIKGLYLSNQSLKAHNQELQRRLESLERQMLAFSQQTVRGAKP